MIPLSVVPIDYGIKPVQPVEVHDKRGKTQRGWKKIFTQTEEEVARAQYVLSELETIREFFWTRLPLVGVNGKGALPRVFIHIPELNAYYAFCDQSKDKDFAFSNQFVACPDVMCREYTHSVVRYTKALGPVGFEGALNEAIADICGIAFLHLCRNISKSNEWRIGLRGDEYMRDLSAPFHRSNLSTDPMQVDHNSRYISYAFYLAASQHNDPVIEQQLLGIWWKAYVNLERHKMSYVNFAEKTICVCEGEQGELLANSIRDIWKKVLS